MHFRPLHLVITLILLAALLTAAAIVLLAKPGPAREAFRFRLDAGQGRPASSRRPTGERFSLARPAMSEQVEGGGRYWRRACEVARKDQRPSGHSKHPPPTTCPPTCRPPLPTGRSGLTTGPWAGTTRGDTFHNVWRTYRTRKDKSLSLRAGHEYDAPGEYTIMVKVIDILGNDTTKTLQVKVA